MAKKIKQQVYENSNGTPILNVMPEIFRSGIGSRQDFDRICLLTVNNKDVFKEIWGEQSCTWIGFVRHWVWLHEFKNCNLFVLTATEVGTSYEIEFTGNEATAISEVKAFLENLIVTLNEKRNGKED